MVERRLEQAAEEGGPGVNIVLRGTDEALLRKLLHGHRPIARYTVSDLGTIALLHSACVGESLPWPRWSMPAGPYLNAGMDCLEIPRV